MANNDLDKIRDLATRAGYEALCCFCYDTSSFKQFYDRLPQTPPQNRDLSRLVRQLITHARQQAQLDVLHTWLEAYVADRREEPKELPEEQPETGRAPETPVDEDIEEGQTGRVQDDRPPQRVDQSASRYYTYRIRITPQQKVFVTKETPDQENLGEPEGVFGYAGDLKQQIDALVTLAQDEALNDDDQVKALGEALFKALFDLRLGQDFVNFYEQAVYQAGQRLRIELNIDEQEMPEIVALPWEFMRAPADRYPNAFWLGTAPDLIFSRRRSQWQPAKPIKLEAGEKLRIALVISAPRDLNDVLYEDVQEVLEMLAEEQAERIELLPVVQTANAREIDKLLDRERPHIFHFIGHGRLLDEDSQATGQIALLKPTKKARWVDADVFSELFQRHRPGIVFLQACESAAHDTAKAFVGVASRVVQQNIPVVVAMQYKVSNDTASVFAMEFYDRLANEQAVDVAAQNGRRGIALEKAYTARDFATPVLFMRVKDGHLFERRSQDYNRRQQRT